MRFQIMHESPGRMRLRADVCSMSPKQADLLEAWLRAERCHCALSWGSDRALQGTVRIHLCQSREDACTAVQKQPRHEPGL